MWVNMDLAWVWLAGCCALAVGAIISTAIWTSAKVAVEQAKTERAAAYAGRRRMEHEAELSALQAAAGQSDEGDWMAQLAPMLAQIAVQNPELVKKLLSGVGAQAGGQVNNGQI